MEIVRPFIQPLMSCIGTPLIELMFGYIKTKENVEELSRLLGDLEAKMQDIQNQIQAAERRYRQEPTLEVKRWIEKVGCLGGEVRTVQTDYDQIEYRCWPNYCWSNYKIGRRASELLRELDTLEKRVFGDLTRDAPPAPVQQIPSISNVVGNMITSNKKKICRYLEEKTDEVIGIWGMGGVGKTTLLEAIHNNFLNNDNGNSANNLFDHVIFIVVSKEHQLENIQKMIVERLHSSEDISKYLKHKNFLLLLDDIWEVVQLEKLGILYSPCSSSNNRHKVVFTTRSEDVCKRMSSYGRIIKVECLEAEEAWNLFKEKVGEDIIDLPGIKSLAKKVIEECGGLPLALVVIGRAMATKKTLPEWDYALTQLRKSQPSNIPGMEMEEKYYFPRLKFSYDNLRDDEMRNCFLCCSLWPEDSKIVKEDLINCWMGLDLIHGCGDINEAYGKGYSIIGSLIVASLLEPVHENEYVIKVHDIIRDLALWIARDSGKNINKWLVKAGVGLKEIHSEVVNWEEAERISLMENRIKELPPHLPKCGNLSTLILRENLELVGIPAGFFTCMPNLTYLDLSLTGLHDIPKEICHLIELRYLNLSNTLISTLPEELGRLINLKYLLLRNTTELKVQVREIIGRLPELEYLDLYPFGSVDADEVLSLPLTLKGVGMEIKITSEHALEQLSRVVPSVFHLAIKYMGGDSSSTTSIHLHHLLSSRTQQSLRELWFSHCRSIRELDVDVRLPSLETLYLEDLENLTEIVWRRRSVVPPRECFPRLRFLTIEGCHGLKDIT